MNNKTTVLLLTAALLSLAGCGKQAPVAAEVRPVRVQDIVLNGHATRSSYSGEVRARYETALGFRIGGKIAARAVDVGAVVKPGTLLARLDPQDLQLNLVSARSQLAAARSDARRARTDLLRYKDLLARKLVSRSAYDQSLDAGNAAQARLEQAQAQLGVAEHQNAYSELRADRAGVITAVEAEAGQVVAAGQTVLRIARPEEKEIVISVPENRLDEVRVGQQAAITLWADPGAHYQGEVREVSPSADPVTRTYTLKVSVRDADSAMQLGMTANVVLQHQSGGRSAELPLSALYQKDRQPAVWVVDPDAGTVKLVPVTIGEYRDSAVTILSGLKDGDRVVTAGVHKLVAGQKVRILAAGGRN